VRPPSDIALIGSFPPPFGGVANHIRRLSALLDQRGLTHTVYNAVSSSGDGVSVVPVGPNRAAWLARYAVTGAEPVVYIFSDRLIVWSVGAFLARVRGKRVIVRLRNKALPELTKRPATRRLAAVALRSVTTVIAVSRALADLAIELGVPAERVVHQPGFLPPGLGAANDGDLGGLQRSFLACHDPIVAANGKVGFHYGSDLYGLDHLVELAARLAPEHPRLGVVVSFWDHQPEDETYLLHLRRRAAALGVADHILFFTESRPFVPVLERATVFVRPTCTDGDANSVREALYLGVPAIASDVVERPPGTILHRTRDLDDLYAKVSAALRMPGSRQPRADSFDLAGVERYLDLLAGLVGRDSSSFRG